MASPDALRALLESLDAWENFRHEESKPIDLTAADLEGADLSGRNLSDCNFTGSLLSGASLDDCALQNTVLDGADLSFTSIVRCQITGCSARGASFQTSVFRSSKLTESLFEDSDLSKSSFVDCVITTCKFREANLEDWRANGVRLFDSSLAGVKITGAKLDGLDFKSSRLTRISGENATLSNITFGECDIDESVLTSTTATKCAFLRSRIRSVDMVNSFVADLDFSYSILFNIDLKTISLSTATLLDTTFVECKFPSQQGKVTWYGNYRPSEHLMRQPVQDTKGLPARLRREIADAQFIVESQTAATRPDTRLALHLWGASCAFGQSLARLTVFMAIGCVLIAIAGSFIDILSAPDRIADPSLYLEMVKASLFTLLGIADNQKSVSTEGQQFVGAGAKIFGFFILGLWVGIAANKLGKLSSQ